MGACLLIFLLGIIVLLFSVDAFVKISSKVWLALRISPLIIGVTIVAIGTSLPELIVSLIASAKNDQGLAVGNIVGSNIINVFFVLGVGILLGNINIGTSKTQRSALFLVLATAIYLFLGKIISSPMIFGLIMIATAVVFSWFEVHLGILGRDHEDKAFVNGKRVRKFNSKMFWSLLLAFAGVVGGGFLVVDSIERISLLTGYSTTILGLSVIAVVTSLPELLTTVFSRKKDQGKIAIGNILGSNIYNLLLVGGIISLVFPVKAVFGRDLYTLAFATFCAVILIFVYAGKKVPKKIGAILLVFFFLYLLSLR